MNSSIIFAIRNRGKEIKRVLTANKMPNGKSQELQNDQISMSRKAARKEDKQNTTDKQNKLNKAVERQLTIMLLLVSLMFMVLGLPYYGRIMTYTFLQYRYDAQKYATFVLVYHITNKCLCINSSINIFLYCLGGSRFRKDLWRLLTCQKIGKPKDIQNFSQITTVSEQSIDVKH